MFRNGYFETVKVYPYGDAARVGLGSLAYEEQFIAVLRLLRAEYVHLGIGTEMTCMVSLLDADHVELGFDRHRYMLDDHQGFFDRKTLVLPDVLLPADLSPEQALKPVFDLVHRSIKNFTIEAASAMIRLQHYLLESGMTRRSARAELVLTLEQRTRLRELAGSRTAAQREVERAKILLAFADGAQPTEIQRSVGVSRPTIYKCIDKALAAGVETGLRDHFHRPRAPEITEAAKAWVVNLACRKPVELGLAAELWSLSALADYVVAHAAQAGFARLAQSGKTTVWRILNAHDLKPHRVRYYLEQRDAQFERKMAEVLVVYRDVALYRADAVHDARPVPIFTVSVDEKPGVQALGTTAPDLPPVPGRHSAIGRDHEYVRHGTLSIIAALDLHTGQIIANVEPRHRSVEFVALLKRLDVHYPSEAVIRVVLDNHSAHISKETMAYLASRPGRFEYVHTPKHGSWLNLVESAFSKMARSFLRHIRVKSLDELKERILKGIDEMNAHPVRFQWKSFDMQMA
jgi:transposase